jgi:hypothetical protein
LVLTGFRRAKKENLVRVTGAQTASGIRDHFGGIASRMPERERLKIRCTQVLVQNFLVDWLCANGLPNYSNY